MTNRTTLFLASFLMLIAAGVGFMIRNGGVLGEWGGAFGYSKTELGAITGGGLAGFGLILLGASLITDRVGYRAILLGAFVSHLLSAAITLSTAPVFDSAGRDAAFWCLYAGTFLFAIGNGLCEAAINPLVADLYPERKTHYLNVLHAGWPGGLVLGGLLAYAFVGPDAKVARLRWEIPMAMFLVPVACYGFLLLRARFPISEVKAAGVTFSEMLRQFAQPLLLALLLLQALVGYVELGTDSWIVEIMKPVMRGQAVLLIIYTSVLMFALRFFAGPIVERINPLGLLLVSSLAAAAGLYMLGGASTGWAILLAGTVYGIGKTFFWPTMLGVVGEQFPRGGALTMGAVGAVGTLSAGFIAGPMIGYQQDYYATSLLKTESAGTLERYQTDKAKAFLFLPKITALDGTKVAYLAEQNQIASAGAAKDTVESAEVVGKDRAAADLKDWWAAAEPYAEQDRGWLQSANLFGGRSALRWTALVPVLMACGYFALVIYFWMRGGYRVAHLDT
ncbi:MAG: MFS transporter [Pirellulales bacterium]|nr:MFS transporter [Pirellulales bacterium]